MVSVGSMKDQISIQLNTPVGDGQGGSTPTWSTIASEWVKVTQLSYSRALIDAQVMFNVAYQFDMRERGDTYTLDASIHRIVYEGENYTIHSIVETQEDWLKVLSYR